MKEALKIVGSSVVGKGAPWFLSLVLGTIYLMALIGSGSLLIDVITRHEGLWFSVRLLEVVFFWILLKKTFESFCQSCKWWNRYWHWWHEKRVQYYTQLHVETNLHYLIGKINYHVDERERHAYWMMKA